MCFPLLSEIFRFATGKGEFGNPLWYPSGTLVVPLGYRWGTVGVGFWWVCGTEWVDEKLFGGSFPFGND